MKPKNVFLIAFVFVLVSGTFPVNAAITPPEVVNLPYTKENISRDENGVVNLSTALVGAAEIPLISYSKTTTSQIHWAHLATAAVPGNCGPSNNWKCDSAFPTLNASSLSNVATEIYGPSTFGLVWAFTGETADMIDVYKREYMNDMSVVYHIVEHAIQISSFGESVVGAPSIELVGIRYRMAVVIRDVQGDYEYYKLIYMHYVGGSNTSCQDVSSGYQCDVIELSSQIAISSPSLAYSAGNTGIAYVIGETLRYAYPWEDLPGRPANCGPLDTWRCITIYEPEAGTLGDRVGLDYGSDNTKAAIVFTSHPYSTDYLMRATYKGSGGNCGRDGLVGGTTWVYRWDCFDVDAFIDNINDTTYAVAFDPNDYPVISWNNKYTGDVSQRLYIAYPGTRAGLGSVWHKEIVDGNEFSVTGIWNDIAINSAGLTFIGYIQPEYRACGDPMCLTDKSPRLKAAMQWFTINLPVIMK